MSEFEIDNRSAVSISLRSISVFTAVMVLGLSFRRGGILATVTGRAVANMRIAMSLLLLACVLALTTLLVSLRVDYDGMWYGTLKTTTRLSTAYEFIDTQGLGLLLMVQLEFAAGVRRVQAADGAVLYSARGIDLWGRGSFIIVTILNIGRLICNVVLLSNNWDEDLDYEDYDIVRALIIVDFVLKLWLAIVALSALICTAKTPLRSFVKIRAFLSLAAFFVLARTVYVLVLAGYYNLGVLAGNFTEQLKDIGFASMVMFSWMPLIALIFILVALGVGKEHGSTTTPKFGHGTV